MNRLGQSLNPYLLQHAQNPVWWHPWGEEAFELAVNQNRLIFLSIGYSTCHWCHVMEHESFESNEIAQLMNEHFISIKVDREEHPDVDHVYMEALHIMGARGGWPLNMFLTPDRKPFYGGTYFPKDNFAQLLSRVAELWKSKNVEIQTSAGQLAAQLQRMQKHDFDGAVPPEDLITKTADYLRMNQDPVFGGFSEAPKFPPNFQIAFLNRLQIWLKHQQIELRSHLAEFQAAEKKVVFAMCDGGLYDHLEGGFFRYSVDREWTIPHFEKMLYNQALNLISVVECREPSLDHVVSKTLAYLNLRSRNQDGTFFAAEDADSAPFDFDGKSPAVVAAVPPKKEEGLFYAWKKSTLTSLLSASQFDEFSRYFEIEDGGNFEHGLIHLRLRQEWVGKSIPESLNISLNILKEVRAGRPRPFLDEKVLCSWNGLMIGALARVSRYSGRAEIRTDAGTMAEVGAHSLWAKLWDESASMLRRRAIGADVRYEGTLEDYGFFIHGLLELYQTTGDYSHFARAEKLQQVQDRLFWDLNVGGYFLSPANAKDLPVRTKDFTDQALPNANSIAYGNLMTLFRLSGDTALQEKARQIWNIAQHGFTHYPVAQVGLLNAYIDHNILGEEWIVVLETDAELASRIEQFAIHQRPGRLIFLLTPKLRAGKLPKALRDKTAIQKIYVCKNFTCQLPVQIQEFTENL